MTSRSRPHPTLVVGPGETAHTATIIFAHGFGDTPHGWANVFQDLAWDDKDLHHIKFMFPHAPTGVGTNVPEWWKIFSETGQRLPEDETGMLQAAKNANELIDEAVTTDKIPIDRIVLGGFSQGAGLALLTALLANRRIGGLVVLSGFLPLQNRFQPDRASTSALRELPVFWAHGTADQVIPIDKAVDSEAAFAAHLGLSSPRSAGTIEYHEYKEMSHSSSQQEMEDLRKWIKKVIPKEQ